MLRQFPLPDVGEGLTEAEIVSWRVAEGDVVEVNTVLVEIETAKSIVELPSPHAGRVVRLLVQEGTEVEVGTPIIEIDDGEPDAAPAVAAEPHAEPDEGATPATLVGYGAAEDAPVRRRRRPRTTMRPPGPAAPAAEAGPRAKPPVRRYAAEQGVGLAEVAGTGPEGTITRDDVDRHRAAGATSGATRRVPVRGVRRATAEHMVRSTSTHVHVWEWVTLDVTETMALVERIRARREFADVRVTPTLLVARAVCLALRRHPELNASWDDARREIVLHGEVNLGLAAATPRGLVVPVVRGAGDMDLLALAREVQRLVGVAREGRLQPADQSGGTFTVTNVGVFGVDGGTPVINGDESAILCMGAIERRPWVVGEGLDERVEPRWVTTLTLGFDHRNIDGEGGSRFLADVAGLLCDPALAMLG